MATAASAYNAAQRVRLLGNLRIATTVPYRAAVDAAPIIAEDFVGEIKLSLVGPGTGRTYIRHNPYRVHVASVPGQPPATDLGRLMGSYKVVGIRRDRVLQRVEILVGSHVKYAVYLEFGTRRMLPRPHVRPAAARTALKVPGILQAIARTKALG